MLEALQKLAPTVVSRYVPDGDMDLDDFKLPPLVRLLLTPHTRTSTHVFCFPFSVVLF